MPSNHRKIYTKTPNSGLWNKQRDLALLETWLRYWQKGRVKRRQSSFHVYPRLKGIILCRLPYTKPRQGIVMKIFANKWISFIKGFMIVKTGETKCIQFTDETSGIVYSLKVANDTNITFEVS